MNLSAQIELRFLLIGSPDTVLRSFISPFLCVVGFIKRHYSPVLWMSISLSSSWSQGCVKSNTLCPVKSNCRVQRERQKCLVTVNKYRI